MAQAHFGVYAGTEAGTAIGATWKSQGGCHTADAQLDQYNEHPEHPNESRLAADIGF